MRRFLAFTAAALALPARLAGVDLSCSLEADEPGHLSVTWSARRDGVIILVGADDRGGFVPRAAVTLPCGAAGPLSFTGVLRELQEPLGSAPGSDAYGERPGLVVAADQLDRDPGFYATTLPGTLGAWWVPTATGPGLLGAFLSVAAGEPVCVDAAFQLAGPSAAAAQGWYLDQPQWPGGLLGNAALRVSLDLSTVEITGTAGVSAAELAGTGGFGEIRAEADAGHVHVAAAAGGVTPGYWMPAGRGADQSTRIGADVTLSAGSGRLRLRGILARGRLPFAPGSVIPQGEEWSLTAERVLTITGGVSGSLVLEAGKTVEYRASGVRREDATASAAVGVESDDLAGSAEASWSPGNGFVVRACARWDVSRLLRVSLRAGSDGGELSCRLRGADRDREITVRAGIKAGAVSLGLSWSAAGDARSSPGP